MELLLRKMRGATDRELARELSLSKLGLEVRLNAARGRWKRGEIVVPVLRWKHQHLVRRR